MKSNPTRNIGLAGLLILICTAVFAEDLLLKQPDPNNAGQPESKATPDPFALPADLSPQKLISFIDNLINMEQPLLLTEEARTAHYQKMAATLLSATEKVLAADGVNEVLLHKALDARFIALALQARLGDKKANQRRVELAEQYLKDPRKSLARLAAEQRLYANLQQFDDLQPQQQAKLLSDAVEFIKSTPVLNDQAMKRVLTIGRVFESSKVEGLAAKAYDQFAEVLSHSQLPEMTQISRQFGRMANRMRLVGQPFELEGQLATKEPIDWTAYRGKIVLIDFWATWCGPCITELPNLKSLYQGFSSKGFDIIGVSKDTNKMALDRFLSTNKIPWANLFNFDEEAEDHPLAEKYGILTIPYTVLVDKDGKVLKINPSSTELRETLTELLGNPVISESKSEQKLSENEEQK